MPKLTAGFTPLWWLRGANRQTLWPALMRRRVQVRLAPERLELPDGDFVDLQWTQAPSDPSTPVVCVFHGLQGSAESGYVRGLLKQVHARGWRGLVMQFRGCSGVPNRLARAYHAADTGDIRYCLNELRRRYPDAPLAAVGYSLGANALLCYLGESADNTPLVSAAAVSPPLVPRVCADRLNQGFSKVYRDHLVGSLKDSIRARAGFLRSQGYDVDSMLASKDFWEIDDRMTAQLHGFGDVHTYYEAARSRKYMGVIRVPTLLITSSNDPFFGPTVVPEAEELSDQVRLEVSAYGGHVGFVGGRLRPRYWLEERLPAWLEQTLPG